MRDHTKLKAFKLADDLALEVYEWTNEFPKTEQFGLVSQMRRAAVSTVSNIVEGAARKSLSDYLRFLDMSYGSARELQYQVSLSHRLGFLEPEGYEMLKESCIETTKVIHGLINSLRK